MNSFTIFFIPALLIALSLFACNMNDTNSSENIDTQSNQNFNEIKTDETDKEKELLKDGNDTVTEDKSYKEMQHTVDNPTPQTQNLGNSKKGKEIFINTCASCHGMEGKGDGVASVSLDPKPRNLTNSDYVSELSDNHLYKVISFGGVSVGKSVLMPRWGEILSEEQIWSVISHIRENICKCSYKGEN